MSVSYDLEPLSPEEIAAWDKLIADYPSRELFHSKTWLAYLAETRGVDICFWKILEDGRTVGHFCGGTMRKGPFRILGSPLKGWGTNYMGPLFNGGVDPGEFLRALDRMAEQEHIAMLELEQRTNADVALAMAHYEPVAQPTYVVALTPEDPEAMWDRIDVKSRQKIRKARRMGVIVEETDDPTVADEFYDQFVEVLARKNLFPPYGADCPRILFRHLHSKGLLFAFRLLSPDGKVIATGLFPHDEQTVYFWGGASRIASWSYCPNDLLQWAVMETAATRGLRTYNMCGYGFFKSKFGGSLQEPRRWHKFYSRSARWGRQTYAWYFKQKTFLRGRWEHLWRDRESAEC